MTHPSVDQTPEQPPTRGVGSSDSSASSLARELAHPESMLRRSLILQVARLRTLADAMEEEGRCLKILGTTEKRIPHAFSRGAEMCGAADMARDWAENLEALLPNNVLGATE